MVIRIVDTRIESIDTTSKIRHITDAVASTVGEFGFRSGELHLISDYVNSVFRLETDRGCYLVRVHRSSKRTTSEIESELEWLDALRVDERIRISTVQRTFDGRSIVMISVPDVERLLPVTLMEWMSGRTIGDEKGTSHFNELGKMTAVLHRHAQTWSAAALLDRPTFDSSQLSSTDLSDRLAKMIGAAQATLVCKAISALSERLQFVESDLGKESDMFGLIHGDLSFGNVLFDNNRAVPIDFDDCGFGYYLHDLSVPLAGAWQKPNFDVRYQAFIDGYREICELPQELLQHVPVFLGLRSVQLIRDYTDTVPWAQGIIDQYRTRLLPALETSDASFDWIR